MKVEKSGESSSKKLALFAFAVAFMFLFVGFALSTVYDNGPSHVGNGTTQTMLKFNVSNTSVVNGTGEAITNITINNTGSAIGNNITNVTVSNGTWTYFNDSFSGRLANITINENITGPMNLTVNYTINSSSADGETVQAEVTQISNQSNVTHHPTPFNSTTSIIDSVAQPLNYSSNGTLANNSDNMGNLTVNVTTSDASLDTINISVNGSVVKTCNSSSPCSYTNNSNDGVYEFNASYNTTTGKTDSTPTRIVTIDNTKPSATASCEDINSGQELDCTCSGGTSTSTSTDADDGVNEDQHDIGTHTFTCTVTDDAGNSATDTAEYTVSSSGGGGSSGSGSGVSKSPAVSRIWNEVNPGEASVMTNFNEDTGLREISINVNNPVKDVKIEVSKYDGKPAEVSVEKSGNVYRYLEINADRKLNDEISEATISAKVEKSWLEDNSLNMDQVSVYKFDESAEEWTELDTSFESEDESYYYYDANVDGFSFFSIGESSASGSDSSGESGDTTTSEGTGDTSGDGQTSDTTNQSDGISAWIWIVIVLVVVGVVAYFVLNRKSSK